MLRIPIEKTCWKHKDCLKVHIGQHEAGWGPPRSLALKFTPLINTQPDFTVQLEHATLI